VIALRFRSDFNGFRGYTVVILEGIRGDCAAITQRLLNEYSVIPQQVLGDGTAITQRLLNDYRAIKQ
jgi:hypothetical protein